MTEKRFKEIISTQKVIDTQTGKEYDCLLDNDFYDLVNSLAEENEQLKEQLNDITLDWTQNHIEFDKDELYVKDNNTEIILKGQNLFISVFIPKIKEYFKLNYIVTGRKLEREYNTIKGEGV